ncbi:hypothetical protein [Latilactobacillus curvatus]|uniref:hypothetical protein n=1 Tax=Latilactobacillus curvatus TaxID=28038 RepID=UPI0021A4B64A|nr:hypothetical protein [Latilactobacillus curvatus]
MMKKDNQMIVNTNDRLDESRSIDLGALNRSMTDTDVRILEVVQYLQLPVDGIVANIPERSKIFRNLEDVVNEIEHGRDTMIYLSKFIYATANGLFDAALNYLWDATINELRERIANFDVEYFYDVTVSNQDKRTKLSGPDDLQKIQDSDLLIGARKIELISSIGFKQLDNIRYMRNWASTAHPNEVNLTGLELIDWLEQCIVQVFNVPYSSLNIVIQKLLSDIKKRKFSDDEIKAKIQQYVNLSNSQVDLLLNGFFGIYISNESAPDSRDNIAGLVRGLWESGSETTKESIGIKYGNLVVNGHKERAKYARDFIEIVQGQSYIPEDLKITEVSDVLSELKEANDQMNNFYTEPPLAKRLLEFVGKYGNLPNGIENAYVHTVVYCFLTNGYGVAWNAEDKYTEMIQRFTQSQAMKAIVSFKNEEILVKLDRRLGSKKFIEMLALVKPKIIQEKPKELIDYLTDFHADRLVKFLDDSTYKKNFQKFVDEYYVR